MSPRNLIRLSIATVLAATSAFAVDPPPPADVANWKCEMCPFDKGYDGSVTAGAEYASGANASYGRYYNGLDHEGTYADVSASGDYVGENGRHLEYAFDDVGLKTRRGMIRGGTYGVYDITVRYDGIPVARQDETVTPFSGGTTQLLPNGWTAAGSPMGMTDLQDSLHGVRIGTERRTYSVDGRVRAPDGFSLFARFERQEKTGNQILGAGFLTQAVQLAAPLSYTTDTVEAGVDWSGERRSARLTMSDSKFHNSDPLIAFQDPYLTLSGNTEFGAVSRPPETDARQWSLTGTTLAPLHSSVSMVVSQTELKNDAPLVPSIYGGTVPATTYDGKVVLTHLAATLSSHPFSNLSVRGRASYDERVDDGSNASWQQYLTDQVPSTVLQNLHYGFERSFVDGSADWRIFRQLSIGVAGDRRDINRTESVVAKTADGRTYGRARWMPGHGFEVTVKGGFAHREATGIDLSRVLTGQDPLISIYNLSNRDRDFGEVDATLAGKTLGLSVQMSAANDRYGRSTLGLLTGRERRAAGTLTWTPSETLSAYLDGGYQQRNSTQAGRYDSNAPLWSAAIRDRYTHLGVGGHWAVGKWDYTADYTHAQAEGDTAVGPLGGLSPFPVQQTQFDSYRFAIGYAKSDALTIKLRWAYQNYTAADWAYDGVTPSSLTNLLALGAVVPEHSVNVFALSFTYRYGKRAGAE